MYCNHNVNGKWWAIVDQNCPDQKRIWITDGSMDAFVLRLFKKKHR